MGSWRGVWGLKCELCVVGEEVCVSASEWSVWGGEGILLHRLVGGFGLRLCIG